MNILKKIDDLKNKIVIFDLDGTLARDNKEIKVNPNGKLNWDKFFDPNNISMDKPNHLIKMAQTLHTNGYRIQILSGRSIN